MANNLERVLRLMAEKSASDVYMSANMPIQIKINGAIHQLSDQLLGMHQTRQLLSEMLAPQQLEELDDTGGQLPAFGVQAARQHRGRHTLHSGGNSHA
jgi:twitching motility protein PilU